MSARLVGVEKVGWKLLVGLPHGCPADSTSVIRSVVTARRQIGRMAAVWMRLGKILRCAAHKAANGC
jgi:hypothetical protein